MNVHVQVTFELHETFTNPRRTIDVQPFEVTEHGWGEFEIGITVRRGSCCGAGHKISAEGWGQGVKMKGLAGGLERGRGGHFLACRTGVCCGAMAFGDAVGVRLAELHLALLSALHLALHPALHHTLHAVLATAATAALHARCPRVRGDRLSQAEAV